MTKNQKIWMWVGLGLAASVGGYFLYRHFTKDGNDMARMGDTEEDEYDAPRTQPVRPNFPLKKGSRGNEVKVLQQYLNRSPKCKAKAATKGAVGGKSPFPLDEDGIFGSLTLSALQICYNTDQVTEELWNTMESSLDKLSV
jgi:hypothetical protein